MMLPECRNAINLLNDGPTSNEEGTVEIRRAHVDLSRAKEILMQYSQYEVANTIDLLECDLWCSTGDFDKAFVCLSRYEYHSYKKIAATTTARTSRKSRIVLQFEKARLLVSSGKFHEALSEYEDLLERMEIEVQERIEMKKMDNGRRSNTNNSDDDEQDILPVIDAVSAVTGVGITKLLLHLRSSSLVSSNNIGGGDVDEIIESLDTATEMLLESRKDALLSPIHYQLAVDLGLAASISLTNAGVAYCLLSSRRLQHDDNDHHHHNRAMELWQEGLATLDMILVDAANSLVVIPRHKFICMESVRARLYCNIACTLLGLYSSSEEEDPPKTLSDEILKEASDAAKKALDIYDELMNGSKFLRDDGSAINDGGGSAVDDGPSSSSEWEEILREQAATKNDGASPKPPEVPLSSIGMAYHKCELARALGLLARCYALAGSAVTAEGLFQSAMDLSSSHPFGRKIRYSSSSGGGGGGAITRNDDDDERIIEKGVSVSSANLSLIARDVRLWKAMLYDDWDKRERDADRLRCDALLIENDCTSLKGYVRDKGGIKQSVSGLEASLYLFSPSTFK
jgi:tetratricopeptide (TPR) repeat protein